VVPIGFVPYKYVHYGKSILSLQQSQLVVA
jgi:hypothetical protein